MRNFTKLMMAFVAFFACACVTDATEDVAPQVVGAQTEITLSLDESRTHIAGKQGEEYPLYWSAGDKIAINGVASEALTEEAHGKTVASFVLNGELTYPYNLTYPAPAEGVVAAEGKQAVTFLANQNYEAGTFAEGATPMCAYVQDEGNAVALQHLAGILCFAPKGEVSLKAMTIAVEEGKLAGNFDVDCASGELTAHADASNSVTVSFGEGLTLGAEATPIYVAVPAGSYGVVTATLYTATDSMTVSFTAEGEKSVKAGVVREFAPFEYKASATNDVFLIYDESSLRLFAANADNFGADATFKSAKVVADVDMTGKEWTSIMNKTEFVLDGGNYAIKGLTAPLFDTTMVSVKNLRLADVNIVETKREVVGALARVIASENAVVENCSVSGNIKIDYEAPGEVNVYVGGIVGVSSSTKEFSNLVNSADIEIGKLGYAFYCSGIVCHAKDGAISNATNLGNISFVGESAYTLRLSGITFICPKLTNCVNGSADAKQVKGAITVSGTLTGGVRVGALMPELDALKNTINITDCANYGAFTINSPTTLSEVQSGGLLGLNSNDARTVNITNSHNYGNITITSHLKGNIRMGGIIGNVTGSTYVMTECSNHGNLSFNATTATGEIRLAGMVAALGGGGSVKVVNGYTNYGDISLGEKTCCTGTNIQVGGIAANYSGSMHSASTGVIKNVGKISYKESADNAKIVRVGGIIAAANKEFNFDNATLVNEGDITVVGNTTGHDLTVGGIYANASKKILNARCYCNLVTENASVVGMITAGDYKSSYPVQASHIGGTISKDGAEPTAITILNYPAYIYNNAPDEETVVNADKCGWLASKDAKPQWKFLSGQEIATADELVAFAAQVAADANLAENVALVADIDMSGKEWTPIEGYAGTFNGQNFTINGLNAPLFGTTKASITNLKLTNLAIEITEAKAEYGAIAGKINSAAAYVANCSASGTMKINPTMTESITGNDGDIVIGGLVGVTTSSEECYDLVNEVNVEISGTYKNDIIAAGLIGLGESCSLSNSTNLGSITYNGSSANHVFIGGLVVVCKEVTDCVNGSATDASHTKGSLTIDGKTKNAYAAGFAPTVRSNISLVRCHNYGAITYTENANTGGATLLGGAIGYCSPSTAQLSLDSCSNHGPILVDNSVIGGDLKVGGIIGHLGGTPPFIVLNGYTNTGDFTINPKSVASSKSVQVGGMVGNYSGTWSDNSTGTLRNKGNITYAGDSSTGSTVRIAGILAALAKVPPTNLKLVNTGNLNVTGTGKYVYVGGILGAGKNVVGADCHCEIYAPNATAVGWIMAAARSTTLYATDCRVGGVKVTGWDDSDMEPVALGSKITATNFMNYIYSGANATDWTGTENYDGCTFLSAKPK